MSSTSAQFTIRILRWVSLSLVLISAFTCFVGPRYEASKLSITQRTGMSDIDWIGSGWIALSFALLVLAALLFSVAIIVRRRFKRMT